MRLLIVILRTIAAIAVTVLTVYLGFVLLALFTTDSSGFEILIFPLFLIIAILFFYFRYFSKKRRKNISIIVGSIGIILLLVGLILSIIPIIPEGRSAKNARVIAEISQIKTIAEIIYQKDGSYKNLHCGYNDDTKALCDDIKKYAGNEPTIQAKNDAYCIYAKLPKGTSWSCLSESQFVKTYINPGGINYCNGETFLCPAEKGTPQSTQTVPQKLLNKIFIIIGGIIIFGDLISSYFKNKS